MDTNNNIKNSPVQTSLFDVNKLAAAAQVLRQQDNPGFFNTTNKEQRIQDYFDLLNEYASISGISKKAVEVTFKNVTGIEYSVMEHKHTASPTMVASAA